jgi:hypothetical protein
MQKYAFIFEIRQKFKKYFYFCSDYDFNIIPYIFDGKEYLFNNRKDYKRCV